MTLKQLLWVLCVLGSFCVPVTAQSNAGTSTPKTSPNSKSKIADGAKRPIVIAPEKAKPIVVPRFDKPPVIDGKLDDEVWKQAVVLKDFLQTQPGDNIAPSK